VKPLDIRPAERRVATWRRRPGETVHEAMWEPELEPRPTSAEPPAKADAPVTETP